MHQVIRNRERQPATNIECRFSHDELRVFKPLQVNSRSIFSNASVAWLLVQGDFSIHHVVVRRFFLYLRVLFAGSSPFF